MNTFIAGCFAILYWLAIEFTGYLVARLAIPLLSFGRAYVQPLGSHRECFNWLGYRRDEGGRIEVAVDVAGYIGLFATFLVVLAIILLVRPF